MIFSNVKLVFKSVIFGFASINLLGCATAQYSEPAEPAPKLWQGASGHKFSDTKWQTTAGRYTEGAAFARTKLENIRTAVLEEPITFEDVSRMGYTSKTKTLPKGTPLYARQYTHSVTTSYGGRPGYTRTQSAWRNPIEWCAEGVKNEEGILSGWTCMFWQTPDKAYFASSAKGHPQSPVIGSDGSQGPMPVLRETNNVSFNSKFEAGLVITQLRKKDATISLIIGGETGEEWAGNSARFQRKQWDENDSISLVMAGGEFKLTAIRPKPDSKPSAVDVEILKPPTVSKATSLSPEDQMKLLKLLLDASK